MKCDYLRLLPTELNFRQIRVTELYFDLNLVLVLRVLNNQNILKLFNFVGSTLSFKQMNYININSFCIFCEDTCSNVSSPSSSVHGKDGVLELDQRPRIINLVASLFMGDPWSLLMV